MVPFLLLLLNSYSTALVWDLTVATVTLGVVPSPMPSPQCYNSGNIRYYQVLSLGHHSYCAPKRKC